MGAIDSITADPERTMRVVTPEGEKLLSRDGLEADILDTFDRQSGRSGGDRPSTTGRDGVETNRTERQQLAGQLRPPLDDDFDETGILDSWDMERLATQMIADYPELRHIARTTVRYAWKRRGGKSRGDLVFGKCKQLAGDTQHYAEADFAIQLSADHVRDAAFGPDQIEALLHHELLHIGQIVDEDPDSATYGEITITLRGHDFEGFADELLRHGAWRDALRLTVNTVEQLRLGLEGAA